jgi:hypothetical protein
LWPPCPEFAALLADFSVFAIVLLSGVLDGGRLQRFVGIAISGRVVACNGDHGI